MGKGKSSDSDGHETTPLSSLKDPASFGPPPKRVPGQPLPPPSSLRSNTSGLGAPLSPEEMEVQRRRQQEAEEATLHPEEETRAPSGPYRPDTTGLTTANLPKPPRRAGQPELPPSPATGKSKPPSLPPRLPPRTNQTGDGAPPPRAARPMAAAPPTYTSTAPPQPASPSEGHLNQDAVNSLGKAGISIPGFGIGRTSSPSIPPRHSNNLPSATSPTSPIKSGAQLGELQARFSKMNNAQTPPPSTGTTWAEKQAALRTASDFKKDPTSVSLADARVAASTANNFRERHGEQVASGYKAANNMNQKYGLMDKAKSYTGNADSSSPTSPGFGGVVKKAPPPPPMKKRELMADPPPVPLGSKPKPSSG
jgi:hypothetical protein